MRLHELRDALVAGGDGLACLRALLENAPACLAEGGLLALETGTGQHEALAGICRETGSYRDWRGEADLSKRPRFFFAWA